MLEKVLIAQFFGQQMRKVLLHRLVFPIILPDIQFLRFFGCGGVLGLMCDGEFLEFIGVIESLEFLLVFGLIGVDWKGIGGLLFGCLFGWSGFVFFGHLEEGEEEGG